MPTPRPLRGLRVMAGTLPAVPGHRADLPVDAPTLADHYTPPDGRIIGRQYGDQVVWCPPCADNSHGMLPYGGRHAAGTTR